MARWLENSENVGLELRHLHKRQRTSVFISIVADNPTWGIFHLEEGNYVNGSLTSMD